MNEKNTQKLYTDFPRLYRAHEDGLMRWGFSCGDGWFDLIYKLSADVEAAAGVAGLNPASDHWPRAVQVKEKFGTLRYYIRTPSPEEQMALGNAFGSGGFLEFRPVAGIESIHKLIQKAEAKSSGICEGCGLPGDLKTEGWWHVTCQVCDEIREKERNQHEKVDG